MSYPSNYQLIGDDMQAVVWTLNNGDTVQAEAGAMMFMSDCVEMEAKMTGGLLGGLKRAFLAGESLFMTHFTCHGQTGEVAFAAPYPGKIMGHQLNNSTLLCQKDAFLCCAGNVDISIAFTKRLGAGFFGGEGFILEKLSGTGLIFCHAGGTIIERTLAPGQALKVDTGCLVAFEPTVDYDIQMVSGIKTFLFGGEGLFYALLRGPGKVWLQTLPFSRMANTILHAGTREETKRGSRLSGTLGTLLGGSDD